MRRFKHRVWTSASCLSEVDLFFPEEDDAESESLAKQICNKCPIESRCLDAAIEDNETEGIWGGCNYVERRTIKMRNNRSFKDFIKQIEPSIDSVVADYMFAQDILNAQSKMQAMQDLSRKR